MRLLQVLVSASIVGGCLSFGGMAKQKEPWGYASDYDYDDKECGLGYGTMCSPEDWDVISPQCKGMIQSPINIDTSMAEEVLPETPMLTQIDECHDFTLMANAHTWQISVADDCPKAHVLTFYDEEYYLHHIEFRSLSEHTLDNDRFLGEVQLVHMNEKKDHAAIISVFMTEGGESEYLDNFPDDLFTLDASHLYIEDDDFSLYDILTTGKYFHYEGSFTTPPCIENVEWFIAHESHSASLYQVSLFRDNLRAVPYTQVSENGDVYRPLQDFNDRQLSVFEVDEDFVTTFDTVVVTSSP
mmetsp:Transcript_2659/g.3908  ORF Transcript_2659/g.3908 Transcript_2659/m.3908 type:complete len:299 (-) Transcript_2659:400-1296(-)|eukprot:CAMPEP_0113944482 /NCGR_PEP_ID=MMETSP1339-20121228/34442_1 /TAXON_ID=94617 /ORGANISM="Fibrocapsa japonica" /LENGTH=298 /DNA_ID=CAMNT_0000949701 /DNA_START=141 /DNA_END=1037 /DNA_ORIENTATION=+ /assembly_acc=CAM_ASM_000762